MHESDSCSYLESVTKSMSPGSDSSNRDGDVLVIGRKHGVFPFWGQDKELKNLTSRFGTLLQKIVVCRAH
jgi:hypothetical protein